MPDNFSNKNIDDYLPKTLFCWMLLALLLSIWMRANLMDRSFDTTELGHVFLYPHETPLKELFTTQYARSKIFLNLITVKLFSGFTENKNILYRLPSFIFFLGFVIFTYYSVAKLLNREIAFISIALIAASPQIIYRSVDYQEYMILIWLSFASIYFMWVIILRQAGWVTLLFFIITLSLNFINSVKAVLIFPVIIFFPVTMLALSPFQTDYFRLQKITILAKMVACLMCSVFITCIFYYLQNVNIVELVIQKITTGKVSMDFINYNNPYGEILSSSMPDGFKLTSVFEVFRIMSPENEFLFYMYLFLSIVGLIYLYKTEKSLFLLFTITIFSTILVGQLIFYIYGASKYYVSIICFYLILVGTGLLWILNILNFIRQRYFPNTKSFVFKIIGMIAVTFILQPIVLIDRNQTLSAINKVDYTPIANYFRKNLKENDVILNQSLYTTTKFPELWHDHPSRIFGRKITSNHNIEFLAERRGVITLYYVTKSNISSISEVKANLGYMDYFPIGYSPKVLLNEGGLKLWEGNVIFDPSKDIGVEQFDTFFWNIIFGTYSLEKSRPGKTLYYYKKSLKEEKFLDRIYNNMGIAYMLLGKPQNSLEYFYKALDVCKSFRPEVIGLKIPTALVEIPYFNIANLLIGFGDKRQQQVGLDFLKRAALTKPYTEETYIYFKGKIHNSSVVNGRWDITPDSFKPNYFLTDICNG